MHLIPASLPATVRQADVTDTRTGVQRRVTVFVPPGPAPAGGWPSLILLDGNAVFGTAFDILRAQAPWPGGSGLDWGVLIALGYPTEEAYHHRQRSWDYSPPPGRAYPAPTPDAPEIRTGGAEELARFLLEDLRPALDQICPLDPARRGLFGHSFGGLFTLYLMLTRPGAFADWIAASPTVTWEDSVLLRHLDGFRPEAPLRALLSAGAWEGTELPPFQRDASDAGDRLARRRTLDTLAATRALTGQLAARPGVTARFRLYEDETHMSVLPRALLDALRQVFATQAFRAAQG